MYVLVYNLLITKTYLIVWLLVFQLIQRLLCCDTTILIILHGINDLIVCHTAFYDVVVRIICSLTASYYKLKPLHIIDRKVLINKVFCYKAFLIEVIYTNNTLRILLFTAGHEEGPFLCLTSETGCIESPAEIKISTPRLRKRFGNYHI